MTVVTDDVIQEMVDVIVEAADPEQIILFGSHVRDEARFDSDVDLLIVEHEPFNNTRSRRQEISRIRRALRRFLIPFDLLVFSREEVEQWQDSINHVIAHALREGKILYARS